ncbi:YbaN family protein [Ligilactobacillus sp. LYQ135]
MTAYAKKTCWLIVAIIFFVLGIIGLIFPVIPQVPFLLIAFFSLSKGSPKFHAWIRERKFYQKYILKFEHRFEHIYQTNSKLAWLRHLADKFANKKEK